MSNTAYFAPTINKEDFNPEKISELILTNFPKLRIESELDLAYQEPQEILVLDEKGHQIVYYWFENKTPYLLKGDGHQSDLQDIVEIDTVRLEKELKEAKLDQAPLWMCSNHQTDDEMKQAEINRFLHGYFKLYWLDEGVHPEYIGPNYVFKPLKRKRYF